MAKKKFHKKFVEYMNMIRTSHAYQELLRIDSKFGNFNWLGTLKSPKGQARRTWWNKQCLKHGIDISQKGCYAKIAYTIHPTKKHVCQCCGKELSLNYVYPKRPIMDKLNKILGTNFKQTDYTIQELIKKFCTTQDLRDSVSAIFRGRKGFRQIGLIKHINKTGETYLSPGAMSNSPDRFDGFHSYGLCCRKTKDKGRHEKNMNSYAQDRRAYEEWADGDWNKANVLMGAFRNVPKMICPKCKMIKPMTADHIGPISLGFRHTIHFAPMCKKCNSSKNNRFTKSDVDKLIALEKKGVQIISWHSKYVWDKLKNKIENDKDATMLSKIMNATHKNILFLFFLLYSKTGPDFLMRYLHPEYAMFNHRVSKLDLSDSAKTNISSKPANSVNKQKLKNRYVRIAFESLEEMGKKKNRKVEIIVNEENPFITNIVSLIEQKDYKQADEMTKKAIKVISDLIIKSHEGILSKINHHPNFDKYAEMIVAHPNYRGLYYDRDKNGKVNWAVAGKSEKGQRRQAWWDDTCRKLGVKIQKGCYAKVARMIHPTGLLVCRCCGKERSIFYEYPTLGTLKKLNKEFGLNLAQTDYTIREFIKEFCKTITHLNRISALFGLPCVNSAEELISIVKSELIDKESDFFVSGALSNLPDQYDGFHPRARCCRKDIGCFRDLRSYTLRCRKDKEVISDLTIKSHEG